MEDAEIRRPFAHAVLERLGALDALDRPAVRLAGRVRALLPAGAVKGGLSGSWLGHALHPLLIVVPIGAWSCATVLDLVRGRDSARSSELLIGVGILASAPTVVTGWMDWADSEPTTDEGRRIGLLHGISSMTALAFYGASLAARRRGRHPAGVRLGLAGLGALTIGDWLGGDLSFARGVGVNRTAFLDAPHEWTAVLEAASLADDRPVRVAVGELELMVVRRDRGVYALANRCSHCGASLHEGKLIGDCVECPRHGTRFRITDGSLKRGPSAYPQPAFETRMRMAHVEVRARTGTGPAT